MLRKMLRLFVASFLLSLFVCSPVKAELPVLKAGFIFTTHHIPFIVSCAKGEAFKELGVWLRPVEPRVSYELMKGDTPVALLDLVVSKSGSEMATLFAQKHLDIGIGSVTAIMAGIDKGTDIKVICPLQTEGMGLIAPKGSPIKTLDDFLTLVKTSDKPVVVGFHSPTSAPKIVFEGAMTQAGFKVTLDPSDTNADILLADLKETSNLLSALMAKQVDAVVGPSPFPEIAVIKEAGQLICGLGDLSPDGKWKGFPCCVAAVSEDILQKHRQAVGTYVELLMLVNTWSNAHQEEAGVIAAEWLGLPPEAGKMNSLIFLNDFTPSWLAGADKYLEILNGMDKFSGSLKDKNINDIKELMIDDSFLKEVNKK